MAARKSGICYGRVMTDEDKPQIDKFKQAAREHEADENEQHWDEKLKRL